jgi:hypothetical protein
MKINQRIARLALLLGLATLVSRAEETAVVNEPTINVRGQPTFMGEVITQLKQGEKVVILEEITSAKPKKDEPDKWARIQMPANTPVWVNAMFIDPETKAVKPSRLNLRGGPGENYSVVGRLQRGDQVKEIRTVNDWMEIETPPGAYAFVAAHLLDKEPAAAPPPATATTPIIAPTEPPPTTPAQPPVATPPVTTPPTVAAQPTTEPIPPPVSVTERNVPPDFDVPKVVDQTTIKTEPTPAPLLTTPTNQPTPPSVALPPIQPPPAEAAKTDTPATPETLPKRIVRREGMVRGTVSIQAPTYFELVASDNNRVMNYLHLSPDMLSKLETSLQGFKDYVGREVVVTGEEAIDPRWPNTPVIEVETLKLVL